MSRLFLIDSFGFIFRAYHARARSGAPPMRTGSGTSTEAIYIFHNMVRRLIAKERPEYLAAIFESAGPTFRDEAFADATGIEPHLAGRCVVDRFMPVVDEFAHAPDPSK